MKRFASILSGLVVLIAAVGATAQMPPTPAPELKKLDYFAGSWSLEATIGPGPWGSGGKFASTTKNEWMKGEFFLVGHADISMPPELGGDASSLAVYGYDPDKKVYTEDTFDSMGRHQVITGTLAGDTWTWTNEFNYGGMAIQSRMTIKTSSPTSYTAKLEVSADGGSTWMSFWDGKGTKK